MDSYSAGLTPKLTNVLPKHTAGVLTHFVGILQNFYDRFWFENIFFVFKSIINEIKLYTK